jgi:hypothetical protein
MPARKPEAGPMDATAVLLLLQVPPPVVLVSVVVVPVQSVVVPAIGPGAGSTDIVVTAMQPEPSE